MTKKIPQLKADDLESLYALLEKVKVDDSLTVQFDRLLDLNERTTIVIEAQRRFRHSFNISGRYDPPYEVKFDYHF